MVARSERGRGTWLAMAATVPFVQCSCGIVGVTDGWQDLNGSSLPGNEPFVMDWSFDSAVDSNIALTAQIDLTRGDDFVLGLAFGETLNSAVERVRMSLSLPFQRNPGDPPEQYNHLEEFLGGWERAQEGLILPGNGVTGDNDRLFRMSRSILMAHEDKTYGGALIAALSIPWGGFRDDGDFGYHLVWTRDMCHSASALLASGDHVSPLRALVFLATVQCEDGSFYQNFQVDGDPHWRGIQLDEIAFPIILAWRLREAGALENFDPYPMVRRAATALMINGPMTYQERWEECEGYSPSTLAASIAGLVCAASFASTHGDVSLARFLIEYADFLESHLERWTVASDCRVLPGVRHFIRILPTNVKGDPSRRGPANVPATPQSDGDPNNATVTIANRGGLKIAAKDLLDAGFLELVRYGIRAPNDPLIIDSLRAIDCPASEIMVSFDQESGRAGKGWRRYNEDGYGNHVDGGPFDGTGRGGAWPLLTGERGHYELAAGRTARPFVRAIENFAESPGLISEQLWDLPDLPSAHLDFGHPTGSAMPLAWAHAEYIKLVRSAADGGVFDLIPEVAARYLTSHTSIDVEVWNFFRQIDTISQSATLRILLDSPFALHWSIDDWAHTNDSVALSPGPGIYYVDVPALSRQGRISFTFFWTQMSGWQRIDYVVEVA